MTPSPDRPTIGVLALQGDVREHLAALTAAGANATSVRRPAELAAVDGIVLPGGESTTMDKLLHAFGLFEPLRERLAAGLPAYGSCAGMILLADRVQGATSDQGTLGGIDMTVRRNAFGRQVDSFEQDLLAPALGAGEDVAPLRAVFIRAPWVEQVGDGVEVLARTARRGSAAGEATAEGKIVAVRHGRLLATSFHPEIGGETRVHRLFVEMVRDALLPTQQQLTS
ncbi:pyridoxal 5'-phosphate synthase glutaminase subunit PdxT [Georgenia sp. AZ-5]|uniref:pyridoxal 5'-phosphate synthase glutaminase subunit PdxT n=1 Tax=Georgenia sp. AZ-5 TaxID=3367526 RepID=UPI00375510F5